MLLPLLFLALLPITASQGGTQPSPEAPPGMILVQGGETIIGSPFVEIVELLASGQSARQKGQWLLAEHPRHMRQVPTFSMMVSEVTNEQYLAFVSATGAQPPIRWARPAVDAACALYVEETGAKRARARQAGETLPPRQVFNEDRWWQRNWQTTPWEMPASIAKKPVVRIHNREAKRYAQWAGLRLPTEFEFERAIRGAGSDSYPWGNEWERDRAATIEMEKTDELHDVGSFPAGANSQGIVDLIGNVWEWTCSPFEAYPGWTARAVVVEGIGRDHRIDDIPHWDSTSFITRGGSQSTEPLLARASSRQGAERSHRGRTLGFRCAASLRPQIEQSLQQVRSIPTDVRPSGNHGLQAYATDQALLLQRWNSAPGSAKVPGYRVITGHDALLFTPLGRTSSNGLSDLRKRTRPTELLHIGLLSTDIDLLQPPLPAGTYLVALRGAGGMVQRKKEERARKEGLLPPRVSKQLGLDRKQDNIVFLDLTGTPVLGAPVSGLRYGGPRHEDLGWRLAGDSKKQDSPMTYELTFFIPGRSRSGLWGSLQVQFADPSPGHPWLASNPPE